MHIIHGRVLYMGKYGTSNVITPLKWSLPSKLSSPNKFSSFLRVCYYPLAERSSLTAKSQSWLKSYLSMGEVSKAFIFEVLSTCSKTTIPAKVQSRLPNMDCELFTIFPPWLKHSYNPNKHNSLLFKGIKSCYITTK